MSKIETFAIILFLSFWLFFLLTLILDSFYQALGIYLVLAAVSIGITIFSKKEDE